MEFLQLLLVVFSNRCPFMLLLGGTVGGLILGATPGLSPTMAVALLIPFTFQLEPTQGLILLGAAYTSTVAGGAVSAILLRIPGAPANIATALDGHEMASQGRGTQALHVSFMASGVGGVHWRDVAHLSNPCARQVGAGLRSITFVLDGDSWCHGNRIPGFKIIRQRFCCQVVWACGCR